MAKWLLLLYRMPPEPSAPRVAVWRALGKLGGTYLQDGAYVLPSSALHREALATLAHDIRNFGGEATLVDAAAVDDERHLRERLAAGARTKPANAPKRRAR